MKADDEGLERLLQIAFFACAVFAFVMAFIPKAPQLPGESGDKILHMIAFATLGALAAAGWRKERRLVLLTWLAVFGAAIEICQLTPGLHRTADLRDWIADIVAAGIAVVLARIALPPR